MVKATENGPPPLSQQPAPPPPNLETPAGDKIGTPTSMEEVLRQLAELKAKNEELQVELTKIKTPPPEMKNIEVFQPQEIFGPGAKSPPLEEDKRATWRQKSYVLLNDHYMYDQVLPRGTVVGKGTPYPLTHRPSSAMDEVDTPEAPPADRKLRHVEPPR